MNTCLLGCSTLKSSCGVATAKQDSWPHKECVYRTAKQLTWLDSMKKTVYSEERENQNSYTQSNRLRWVVHEMHSLIHGINILAASRGCSKRFHLK